MINDQQSPRLAPAEPATVPIQQLEADPHGVFRHYRSRAPFIRREDGSYIVLRAHDVERLMRDPRTRQAETEYAELRGIREGVLFDLFKYGMLTSNGADHRRRRAPFFRPFTARLVEHVRPSVRSVAEGLVDGWIANGEVDLTEHYASPIPALTISAILGLPAPDVSRFTGWVYSVSRVLSYTISPDDLPEIEQAATSLRSYVEELLADRRAAPRDDFLSACLSAAEQAEDLSPLELVVQIVTLIIAGSDTTRAAIATQTRVLLDHRDQWEAICREPELIPAAVLEVLRYEPAVGSAPRMTIEDIEIDGHILPKDRFVTLSTMSALRDEAVYQNPDSFDIRRTDQRRLHPVFGGGVHRCLGEMLARIELEESLAVLARRLPNLRLLGEPPRLQGHSGIRRLGSLRVHWSGGQAKAAPAAAA